MIKIKKSIIDEMINHAKKEKPNECCGILAGRKDYITRIYKMENTEKSPESFLMKPEEQFKVFKDINRSKMRMLGIYHSHPTSPARPSKHDISMAFYSEVIYFIVSLKDVTPVLKGFRIVDGEVTEEKISIE